MADQPESREFRCAFCFSITDGAEFCGDACADAALAWEEGTVVYPVESKPVHLELVS